MHGERCKPPTLGFRFHFHTTENGFSLHFYEEIFQELSFCSRIIVRVHGHRGPSQLLLRGSGPADPRGIDAHATKQVYFMHQHETQKRE